MTEPPISAGEASARHEARDWVIRLASGEMMPPERARLQAWLDASHVHRNAFAHEQAFWQDLNVLKDDFAPSARWGRSVSQLWAIRTTTAAGGLAAFALVVVLWLAGIVPSRLVADHVTAVGEQAVVNLPDGSVAHLNSDSAIDVRYRDALRLVVLRRGEALFEVKPDAARTFRVAAFGSNTDATGTIFATEERDGHVTVTVAEGSVRVFGPAPPDAPRAAGEGLSVAANQQTAYSSQQRALATRPVNAVDTLAWRNGSLVFDGRPFGHAIAEVGRYIPERIVLNAGSRRARPVSGIFSIHAPYRALEALAATQGLDVYRVPHVAIFIN